MQQQNAAIEYLQQRGIEYQLLRQQDDGNTQAIVRGYGMNPALIAQAHLMQDAQGVVLVVTPRDHRRAPTKLQQLLMRNLQPVDELLVQQLFHCDDTSAIPPLGRD